MFFGTSTSHSRWHRFQGCRPLRMCHEQRMLEAPACCKLPEGKTGFPYHALAVVPFGISLRKIVFGKERSLKTQKPGDVFRPTLHLCTTTYNASKFSTSTALWRMDGWMPGELDLDLLCAVRHCNQPHTAPTARPIEHPAKCKDHCGMFQVAE